MKIKEKKKEPGPYEGTHEERIRTISETSFFKKYSNYVRYLSEDENFKKDILDVRKKFNIPQRVCTDNGKKLSTEERTYYNKKVKETTISNTVDELLIKYGLSGMWRWAVLKHIILNKDISDSKTLFSSSFSVLDVNIIFSLLRLCNSEKTNHISNVLKFFTYDNRIGIFINPYASENDIINYIRKFYKNKIEPIQKSLRVDGVKMGKIRKKNERIQKIEDFLYKHKDLRPLNRLEDEFEKKFGYRIERNYMLKIRRQEIRKRSGTGK